MTTLLTEAGNRLLVQGAFAVGQKTRLRIKANDVSLCLSRPAGTSILNILEGVVTEHIDEDDGTVLLKVDCAGDDLLVRISRLSYRALKLEQGTRVFAQIKSVAIGW